MLLNLISVTYANADILLTWKAEDENNFPSCLCNSLEPHVTKDEALNTVFFNKYNKWWCLLRVLECLKLKVNICPKSNKQQKYLK